MTETVDRPLGMSMEDYFDKRIDDVEAILNENKETLNRIENILDAVSANAAACATVGEDVKQMVHLLGLIQEEAGPVIAGLADNPMIKMMMKGGK